MIDLQARIRALPIFTGAITISPIGGGLSNSNVAVTDDRRTVMVRLGDDLPFHHVFRDREVAASRAAHAAGLSPAVIHAAPGLTVFEFLEARTFVAEDARAERHRLVPLLKRVHGEVAPHLTGAPAFFWVFHVIRDYAATLREKGGRHVPDLPHYLAVNRRLEALQVPMPIVFGHHDLLPANIMEGRGRLWLVDWEYGGYGTPLFDLANLAGNAGFTRQEEAEMLTAYFGRAPDAALAKAYRAMKAASLLREAMWSMVSELTLNAPGADYAAYAEDNLERFEAALADVED